MSIRGVPDHPPGVTLVELLITTSIAGVASLALMTLMADYSQKIGHRENESNLSEQLTAFADEIDLLLGNATLIQSCTCGTGGQCIYPTDETVADCTNLVNGGCNNRSAANLTGPAGNILQFEYEDSTFPGLQSAAGCNLSGGFGALSDGLLPRGCKRRARLTYTPPVPFAGPGRPAPGVLSLIAEDVNGNLTPQVLASITGVTIFRCGHPLNTTVTAANQPDTSAFKFTIEAKARESNLAPGHVRFDSWDPRDVARGFDRGTHRTLTTQVYFRNLTTAGVHYGKAHTNVDCIIDGQLDPQGSKCCSGYWDSGTSICMAAADCKRAGTPAGHGDECCSLKRFADTGNCI